jgi:hypothetical protein
VEKVAKGLINKLSAGVDEISDYVVKQCVKLLDKPLANTYNASLESVIAEVRDHCARQKSDLHTQFCRTTLFILNQ